VGGAGAGPVTRGTWPFGPLDAFAAAQAVLGARVLARMARGGRGERVRAVPPEAAGAARVSVLLPVLDEARRVGACLEHILEQGPVVAEVLVVDGGSTDGTAAVVVAYARRDRRVRLIDAGPVPDHWNGKAWGLQVGFERSDPRCDWLLTLDADVRPGAGLAEALVAHAAGNDLGALSVATVQSVSGEGEALVHPALLTTLVYRLGRPGRAAHTVADVQANGQCFLVRREALAAAGGLGAARDSLCEDVTLARRLVYDGYGVGFYESDVPVSVQMYGSGREAWRNWPRSLTLRDRYAGRTALLGLIEVSLVQAAPLPLLVGLLLRRGLRFRDGGMGRAPGLDWPLLVNGVLLAARLGVLAGTARAYLWRPWTYWLSPLCDLPVAWALWRSLWRREHVWRGRRMVSPPPAGGFGWTDFGERLVGE
jgi:dolichol-phosphate mannosyltransferase